MPTAKEYLKSRLSTENLIVLYPFGHYTLEVLIIHVLGLVFNSIRDLPVVKVSTLVEQLNSAVRAQSAIMSGNKESGKEAVQFNYKGRGKRKSKVSESYYAIGAYLVNFMVERELISLSSDAPSY